jgi:hypothetical protein
MKATENVSVEEMSSDSFSWLYQETDLDVITIKELKKTEY